MGAHLVGHPRHPLHGFADIFRSNSLKNGLLPVVVDADTQRALFERLAADPDMRGDRRPGGAGRAPAGRPGHRLRRRSLRSAHAPRRHRRDRLAAGARRRPSTPGRGPTRRAWTRRPSGGPRRRRCPGRRLVRTRSGDAPAATRRRSRPQGPRRSWPRRHTRSPGAPRANPPTRQDLATVPARRRCRPRVRRGTRPGNARKLALRFGSWLRARSRLARPDPCPAEPFQAGPASTRACQSMRSSCSPSLCSRIVSAAVTAKA